MNERRVDIKAILADPVLRAKLLAAMWDPGPDGTHIPGAGNVAPKLRRLVLDAAESKIVARTQKEGQYHLGVMFGGITALKLMVAAGTATPGIAPGVGFQDPRALAEVARFVGDRDAEDLGFL